MEKKWYFKVEPKATDFGGVPETATEEGILAGHGAEDWRRKQKCQASGTCFWNNNLN